MTCAFEGGIDEAGRGPLAGPVTAGAVVLPEGVTYGIIKDSKQLKEKDRAALYEEITKTAIAWAVVSVGPRRIERLNIREATKFAMVRAGQMVERQIAARSSGSRVHFLVDGNMSIGSAFSHATVVKGDTKIASIAAASIVAKVTRDRLMDILDERYPGYGLAGHKGYATAFHRAQVSVLGPCLIHRRTFAGVSEFVKGNHAFGNQTSIFLEENLDFS